jgi:hypothetical protein
LRHSAIRSLFDAHDVVTCKPRYSLVEFEGGIRVPIDISHILIDHGTTGVSLCGCGYESFAGTAQVLHHAVPTSRKNTQSVPGSGDRAGMFIYIVQIHDIMMRPCVEPSLINALSTQRRFSNPEIKRGVELSDHLVNSYGSSPRSGDFLSFSGEYMRCNVAEGSVSSTAETVVASPASQQSHRQAFSSRNSELGGHVAVLLTEMPFAPSAPSVFNTYIYHLL